ncbi:hypothetical protein DFP72DRAFT_839609 [Ephemerocybe angulata]|uniref:NodB homology domain-containing protein n=1 Tax=Ephemerocybe angulata TaxID=980116 RepID=A0A8H6IHT8_9AGAR|nr:hypothetical protein DFP72DRAFT_839609 [Tulosesus angulatus]
MVRRITSLFCAVLGVVILANASSFDKRQAGKLITRCTVPNTVGMSFDDGTYIYTKAIVDTLKANNASATFFYSKGSESPPAASVIWLVYRRFHRWKQLYVATLALELEIGIRIDSESPFLTRRWLHIQRRARWSLGMTKYQRVLAPSQRDSTWKC